MRIEDWIKTELGLSEFNKKYRHNNESFDEWLDRVSAGNETVKQLIIDKKFIFAGRILANRGLYKEGRGVTYSNCYVIDAPQDNIESIFDTAKKLARTFSYGGGVGIDISKLRPSGTEVHNAAKTTSGAVSFMDLYSMTTELIGQKGRRGALMISMDVNHPDIEEFIDVKTDLKKVTKANISVKVNDEFIEAVEKNLPYELKFTLEDGSEITKTVDACKLMEKLALNNNNYAEPGILYWDKIKDYNLLQHFDEFEYVGVNPCAEEPLPAGGSCLLGAINLSAFVKDPFTDHAYFDYNEFNEVVRAGVFALNDVLLEGLPLHPLEEQRQTVSDYRQIGLGIMGLADALIKLEIPYGSKDSLQTIEDIGTALLSESIVASYEYREQSNYEPFKGYDANKVIESDIVQNLLTRLNYYNSMRVRNAITRGLFNSQLTTIAPTGTIAGLCDTSYGVEPTFAFSYTRKTESLHDKDTYYTIESKIVKEYREATGNQGELPEYFITTHQLDPYNRIDLQAAIQKYIDASISSTLNLANETTPEMVKDLYVYGAKAGVKGLTVYRAGCEREAILTVDSIQEEVKQTPVEKAKSGLQFGDTILVDDSVIGIKRKLKTGCGSIHCTFYFCPETGELREVFLDKGSTGGCLSLLNALSRMSSLAARKGAPVEEIVDQLKSVLVCPSYAVAKVKRDDISKGSSCASAVASAMLDAHNQFLEEYIDLDEDAEIKTIQKKEKPKQESKPKPNENSEYAPCPECGEKTLMKTEGCMVCASCGYSKCS